MGEHLLEIKNLSTSFKIKDKYYAAVDDVSITVNSNEIVAIVGESGCGKSALALSINKLHNMEKTKMDGQILFNGKDILSLSDTQLNKYRGKDISMIFQEPLTALNPLMTIGKQIEESLSYHTDLNKAQRKARACELLDQVGIPKPELTYKQFPHELSGGMRQRAMIAIAVSCNPSLIIADEPTTALDVTIQAQILDLLKSIQLANGMGVILITHDLSVVAEVADRIVVMYAGQVIETGSVDEIFNRPQHPYTRSLLNSVPSHTSVQGRLHVIEGMVPSLVNLPRKGCRFKDRIPWIEDGIHEEHPELHEVFPGHYVRCTCHQNFYFKHVEGEEISHDIAQSK